MSNYTALFEGQPYCDFCKCKLRPIGASTVSCGHTSLTLGVDHLSRPAYDNWMVTERELEKLVVKS